MSKEESRAPSESQVSGSKSSKREDKSRLYTSQLQTLKLLEGQSLLQHEQHLQTAWLQLGLERVVKEALGEARAADSREKPLAELRGQCEDVSSPKQYCALEWQAARQDTATVSKEVRAGSMQSDESRGEQAGHSLSVYEPSLVDKTLSSDPLVRYSKNLWSVKEATRQCMEQSSPEETVEDTCERLSSELEPAKQLSGESLHKYKQSLESAADRTGAAAEDYREDPSSRAVRASPQVVGRHSTKQLSSSYTACVQAAEVSKDTGARRYPKSLGGACELAVTWK